MISIVMRATGSTMIDQTQLYTKQCVCVWVEQLLSALYLSNFTRLGFYITYFAGRRVVKKAIYNGKNYCLLVTEDSKASIWKFSHIYLHIAPTFKFVLGGGVDETPISF